MFVSDKKNNSTEKNIDESLNTEKDLQENQINIDQDEVIESGLEDKESTEDISLDGELENAIKENQELKDSFLRKVAEFDNFRKRTIKEKNDIKASSICDTALEILPILDNFESAFSYECSDEKFKKGIEMILKQFKSTLNKMGITEIDCFHKPFNPDLHNAISQVQDKDLEENIVSQVCQKGYQLEGKVIRHAMVIVANP